MLEITVKGDPKEIAALVLAVQERHEISVECDVDKIISLLASKLHKVH